MQCRAQDTERITTFHIHSCSHQPFPPAKGALTPDPSFYQHALGSPELLHNQTATITNSSAYPKARPR